MTMHTALHTRDDIDRLHVSKKGGRGLTSLEDSIDASIQRLKDYIKKYEGRLISTTSNNIDNTSINKTKPETKSGKEINSMGTLSNEQTICDTRKLGQEKSFIKVKAQRGILQENALSTLLFMIMLGSC